MRLPILAAALLAFIGCATPGASVPPTATPARDEIERRVEELEAELRELKSQLQCALPAVVAFDPDREFTSLTIDKVVFDLPGESIWTPDDRMMLCHVAEWKDYEHFKRFTRVSDKVFYLEATGHPTLHAMMGVGGVTGSSGSTRYAYAVLHLTNGHLVPGVEYALRPRNEVDGYTWVVPDSLRVAKAQ